MQTEHNFSRFLSNSGYLPADGIKTHRLASGVKLQLQTTLRSMPLPVLEMQVTTASAYEGFGYCLLPNSVLHGDADGSKKIWVCKRTD